KGHWGWTSAVAYSPDGNTLVTVAPSPGQGRIALWDPRTLEERDSFRDVNGIVSVAFTPDGRTLVAGCSFGFVELWRTATDADVYDDAQRRLKQEPNDPTRQTDVVLACWAYSQKLHRAGDNDRARQVLEEGHEQLRLLREKSPENTKWEKWSR